MSNPFQYPLSDVRNSSNGPNGWDFRQVNAFETLDGQWYFVPWEKVKLVEVAAGGVADDGKFVVNCVKPVEKRFRGSGIIVKERDSSIIGCYKSIKHMDHGDLLIDIKEIELQVCIFHFNAQQSS